MVATIILALLSLLIMIEGLFIALKPKETKKLFIKFAKSKNLRIFGIVELIMGIIILLLAITSRVS